MPDGQVYLSIEDLFKFLKIPCNRSDNGDTLSGFIDNIEKTYSINPNTKNVSIKDKIYYQDRGFVNESGIVYMETSLFGDFFGIYLTFNLRSLSISVKSNFELPLIKQLKQEKIRTNLNRLHGGKIADTTLGRNYHLFNYGNIDWLLISSQNVGKTTNNRVNVSLGTELLYGETKLSLDYYNSNAFESKIFNYHWRWVDNEKNWIRQINIGKIGFKSISSIYSPLIGFSVSNTPTNLRKSEGYYTISEYTQPNWVVELYINNSLVDYVRADASGLFIFQVPMVYGYTTLELRFYGPMGEERSEKRNINIPYTFTPASKLEYLISGGVLEAYNQTVFARHQINYGLNQSITLGGGVEYLSSIKTGKFIPFLNTSFLLFDKMIVMGEYDFGVRSKASFNYTFYDNATLLFDYTKFNEGQKAIMNNVLTDTKLTLTVPYHWQLFSGYSKIGYQNMSFKNFNYNIIDFSLSGYYSYFNAILSTNANWSNTSTSYIYSNLALSYLAGEGFYLRSALQYDYRSKNFSSIRFELEKKFSDVCNLSLSYDYNINSKYQGINLSFRYNLPFARTFANAQISNLNYTTTQGAQGSLSFGTGLSDVYASEYSMVGRGGIIVMPFLDLNNNDKFDKDETILKQIDAKIDGGKLVYGKNDSLLHIVGLEPFISYMLEVSENKFDNIAWRISKKKISIIIDPNQFKIVEIPVKPQGEINGTVYISDNGTQKGIGRILIQFLDESGNKVAETLTESDGYYSYMGLKPGNYTIRIDENQLNRLAYQSDPDNYNIVLRISPDGEIIEGLDFTLFPKK
jgi:hypothetical protein